VWINDDEYVDAAGKRWQRDADACHMWLSERRDKTLEWWDQTKTASENAAANAAENAAAPVVSASGASSTSAMDHAAPAMDAMDAMEDIASLRAAVQAATALVGPMDTTELVGESSTTDLVRTDAGGRRWERYDPSNVWGWSPDPTEDSGYKWIQWAHLPPFAG